MRLGTFAAAIGQVGIALLESVTLGYGPRLTHSSGREPCRDNVISVLLGMKRRSRLAPKTDIARQAGEGQAEMTPAQCRGARGLLDWTQKKLADAAGVGASTVISFERNWRCNFPEKIQAMQSALEAAGVEFTNSDAPGVRLRKPGMSGW